MRGLAHGFGLFIDENMNIYNGQFINGKVDGNGSYNFLNGI